MGLIYRGFFHFVSNKKKNRKTIIKLAPVLLSKSLVQEIELVDLDFQFMYQKKKGIIMSPDTTIKQYPCLCTRNISFDLHTVFH